MQFCTLVLVSALLPFLSTGYASIVEHVDDLPTQEFDFVVIGSQHVGIGSCDKNDLNTKVPSFFGQDMGSPLDWNFTANLGLAMDNCMGTVVRGFVLGGSSAISGIVYTRGSSNDWDCYADLTAIPDGLGTAFNSTSKRTRALLNLQTSTTYLGSSTQQYMVSMA
ncbi:hypothetical protein D9758_012436 [Tetrapyrgos nigripes]|uniref:Uncharacterized protein n=1 Tax=Tetrapyrgos nigripes TaxID=182062 RepID=A0A8H5FUN1_9AGAR|nr:hypothetical protein D9758_012436 [Tetrapyrgos nigripes]